MHTSLSSNSLTFSDGSSPELIAAVYPSSPESGAAAIGTYGNLATLLDLDDVAALRDFLTLCLVQAGRESEILYSITRADLAETLGEPVPDEMAEAFTATFPLTTVDQCVSGWREGYGWHGRG